MQLVEPSTTNHYPEPLSCIGGRRSRQKVPHLFDKQIRGVFITFVAAINDAEKVAKVVGGTTVFE